MEREERFCYGVQCALEELPEHVPAIFRGSLRGVAESSRKAGYDAMELYIRNPADWKASELNVVAADNGLAYAGICTGLEYVLNGLSVTDDDATARQKAVDRLKEHLDLAAEIDCPVVVGSMRASLPDASYRSVYLERLGDALRQLDAYAASHGSWLLVENINRYISNYLCTVPECVDFIRSLGLARLKLHVDTHSMHIEDKNPAEVLRQCGDVLGYVHVSDANRGYPGAASIDFKAHLHALLDIGYTGYITAECQPFPSQEVCAQRAIDYMKAMESAARIERAAVQSSSYFSTDN